jgi:tRNA threonylcarbamoyladenosine biosynthesis protein TsaE
MNNTWNIQFVEEWSDLAREVAGRLRPGDVLTLQGPLGAGKTTFVQALATVMGAQKTPKSPTFSMLRSYAVMQGKIRRLLHVDAYRIHHEHDLVPLDLDEELAMGDAVLVLEWPENIPKWLRGRKGMALRLSLKGELRHVTLTSQE